MRAAAKAAAFLAERGGRMIYVTGDCHSRLERLNTRNFPEQKEMTKKDLVIVCGDFGVVWNREKEDREEKHLLDWLEEKPFTTLFVDGNHENFDRLYAYPEEERYGGKVHAVRPSVLHLMRGQIFELEGKLFFTFGGASSHDIHGGILDPEDRNFRKKKKELDRGWKPYRINHVSWWKEELPTREEMEEGRRNLLAKGNRVDFIVTHCCSSGTQALISFGAYERDILTDYLEEIRQTVEFKKWFFGHYHDNRNVSEKEILLYEQLIRVV